MTFALRFDVASSTLDVLDRTIELTTAEYRLLCRMLETPGEVVSAQTLLEDVLGIRQRIATSVLRFHIGNLRKKLDGTIAIESSRGVGYRALLSRTPTE